ncbi:hypothetical protein B0H63DRAFT_446294 [Podospora didyma]|uniref:F-box domain-containing protein n=1 Tax=Podospora didyma TaxID=330526 RepID=A0AAE0NYT5_9PEZI|nr:hypothetical protein B0H63DRAFT_446294 [Podospora didyma]
MANILLPDILHIIFEHLDAKDVRRLRLVSKSFGRIASYHAFPSLVVPKSEKNIKFLKSTANYGGKASSIKCLTYLILNPKYRLGFHNTLMSDGTLSQKETDDIYKEHCATASKQSTIKHPDDDLRALHEILPRLPSLRHLEILNDTSNYFKLGGTPMLTDFCAIGLFWSNYEFNQFEKHYHVGPPCISGLTESDLGLEEVPNRAGPYQNLNTLRLGWVDWRAFDEDAAKEAEEKILSRSKFENMRLDYH